MKKRILLGEERLIEEISIKSRIGAEALYDMYSKSLYGAILKIVRNKEIAEDVLQNSFIKIWYSFAMYNAEKGRLFTWMLCITRNLARDTIRSNYYQQYLNTDPIECYNEKIEQHDTRIFKVDIQCIKLNIDNLKKDHKDILNLIYFKGYTHSEVANELDIPKGTVKSRYRLGINILRGIFREPASRL